MEGTGPNFEGPSGLPVLRSHCKALSFGSAAVG